MGINDFRTFLKRYAPNAEQTGHLSTFRGKRLAIDGHVIMHKYMAVCHAMVVNKTDVIANEIDHNDVRKEWLNMIIKYVLNLTGAGVTPIFVVDGPPLPEKTAVTGLKRSTQREKQRAKFDEMNAKLLTMDILSITPAMIEAKRKIMRNMYSLGRDDINSLLDVLYAFGIPFVKARDDSEKLCSSLCIEGVAAGVISTDSDCLTFGCPLLITDVSSIKVTRFGNDANIKFITLDAVLTESKLSQPLFIDLCILMGCDYAPKIRGTGPVTVYKLVNNHGLIESMPTKYHEFDYVRCREIFAYEISNLLKHEEDNDQVYHINYGMLEGEARDMLTMYNLQHLLRDYLPTLRNVPSPTNNRKATIELLF